MEKRRRARINDSLGQLKTLILEATNKDVSFFLINFFYQQLFFKFFSEIFNLLNILYIEIKCLLKKLNVLVNEFNFYSCLQ